MAIPKISEKDIFDALKYIDENGVPFRNQSVKYELVAQDGKKYPIKYVVAVADHIANGTEINTDGFNAGEAKDYLQSKGYDIETNQEKYELVIDADTITSTDERFDLKDLGLGDIYRPIDAYFEKADGEIIRRKRRKSEKTISNQTLTRLTCQVFEKQISDMSIEDRESFPVCQYRPDTEFIKGIFTSVEALQKARKSKSIEYSIYHYGDGREFVVYSWNIFSTIIFAQECLKRFGEPGDKFKLIYREKEEQEGSQEIGESAGGSGVEKHFNGYMNPYSEKLIESKNIIFRGAPGTGKTYLAKEIAADIISNGYFADYNLLSDEQKEQVEFIQFHPSYDYSDFVEGLRPTLNDDGSMGFELQDGVFKQFVERARKNFENSQKSKELIERELTAQEELSYFFSNIELGTDVFKTINGNEFTISNVDNKHIRISIPGNASVNKLTLNLDEVRKMLESGEEFEKIKDVTAFFGKTFATQAYSYDFAIYKAIRTNTATTAKSNIQQEELKKFIFIIDEINRGEISKIFGELFFSIDPGYRGKAGEVSTQYANMHSDPKEKFYIPENVYIIGTMNDIDRSVDTFDFAMRRRFRFIELKADDRMDMLSLLNNDELQEETVRRMMALNKEIADVEDLNENYQIGASYFLKLKNLTFDQLWTDYLRPLLQDYVNGMYDEEGIMSGFAKAYGYADPAGGDVDETAQD